MSQISPASRSRMRVSQVVESTRGVTPSNPSFKVVPHLDNTNFNENQTFERSNEVKSNRMGGKQVGGNNMSEGTLGVPLKNDAAIRELFESAFSCTFTTPTKTGATMAFVSNGTRADGDAVYSANPEAGDTITINGVVFTYVASAITSRQVTIGASLAATMANLVAKLNAHGNANVALATYAVNGTTDGLLITYDEFGTDGNAFTVAWTNATVTVNFDASGAATSGSDTLAGGAGTNDTITNSGNDFLTLGFQVGMTVTVANSTTAGNDGTYKITAIAAGVMTLDRDINTAEAFGAGTVITASGFYGLAGTTRKTFTHEVAYLDIDPIVYEYYRGMEVNTMNIQVPTSGEVSGEIALIGLSAESTEIIVTGGTYAASSNTVPFAGSVEGASLDRGGVNRPDVETISLSINNNRAAKFAVGQPDASHVEEGDWDLEISASLYFIDLTVQEQYLAGTRTSMTITLKDQQDGHKLVIEIPNLVFTEAPKGLSGQTIVQNLTAFAEEDPTYSTKARVWFIPAS